VIGGLARRTYGNAVIVASARGQRRVPFQPRERLERRRDARIRGIVGHAAATVPHYREWFRSQRIDPREISGPAELRQLPILDREQVRAEPERFLSDGRAARGALSFSTSGTTGTPLTAHHDRRSLLANIGWGERERGPVIDLCGGSFRPSEVYVGYETSTFKKVSAFYAANSLLPVKPARRFVPLSEPVERIAEILDEERPDLLVGYGGWLDLFFSTLSARGARVHPPKLVMYMGEALPPGSRERIESEFGIPVMSRYNAVEAFKIGFYCERRTGFHVHEDLCHVRIVGADGEDVATGRSGSIVISNLVNRATVLLNYPIGDVASISKSPCPCGRTFQVLSELEGRLEDMIPLADGRVIHPREVWQVFKHDPQVLQYRLVQHEPDRFELELLTEDEAAFSRARDRAMPELLRLLGADAKVATHRRAEAELSAGGKYRAVASLLPRGDAEPVSPPR